MSLRRKVLTFVAPAALLLAGGCAESFKANVSRFQMMPPPEGQTFFVQASDPRLQGGIEFQTYAQQVASRLTALGYRPGEPGHASLVVSMDYGVDNGHTEVVTTPGIGPAWGWGHYGAWGGGYRRPIRVHGRIAYGRGFYYGWDDPFWYDPFGYPEINSYTFFISHLDMKIRRASDGQTLFEGKASARSTDQSLPHIVPNLVEAMFTGFPGRSGEDVRITIPPPPKNGQAPQAPTIQERHHG
ncbi:MAG: DUF4136 domain-containing protein [Sphingomonas sp.]|nr:DUF4136 domain-containing protein [Sphingomonas sp.]